MDGNIMKLKILIAILLFPFVAMAANTNVFDRVLIRQNFQFTGGSFDTGYVLQSDAAGFYTPLGYLKDNGGSKSLDWTARILYQSDGVTPMVEWSNAKLNDLNGTESINWSNRTGYDSGDIASYNWNNRTLINSATDVVVNWETGTLSDGSQDSQNWLTRILFDAGGNQSVLYSARQLLDNSEVLSQNWNSRLLYDNTATATLDYQNKILIGDWNVGGFSTTNVALKNANNTFTIASTNTFNAPTFTSNLFVRGYIGLNTNGPLSTSISFYSRPPIGTVTNFMRVEGSGAANFAGYTFGDINANAYGRLSTDGGGNVIMMVTNSTSYIIQINGENQFVGTASLSTFGNNASDAYVFNGTTESRPNGSMLNSGVRYDPPSIAGTVTNGAATNLFTAAIIGNDGVTCSNLTVKTINGESTISSGTNLIFNIDTAGGSGFQRTKGMFLATTNTLAGINVAMNTMNTNGSQRLHVDITVAYGANSGTFIYSSTAQSPKSRRFTSVAGTNFVDCWIQPFAVWAISNYVGTATVVPGEGHLEYH
jgi:hypothetical protein